MRITTARVLGLLTLAALLLGGAAAGEAPPTASDAKKLAEEKKPSQLEELIAQALRDNPDLRVAESDVRKAEAVLQRVRLQVIQKVVAHQHAVENLTGAVKVAEANYAVAQAKLKIAETDYKRMSDLVARKAVATAELDTAQANREQARANLEAAKAALQAAKADLAKAQAELPYLLGKATKDDKEADAVKRGVAWLRFHTETDDEARLYALEALAAARADLKGGRQPQGTVTDKLRKALDTPINLKVAEQPLDDVLKVLQARAGVPIVSVPLRQDRFSLELDNVPLGAAFQAVEDVTRVQFGVRDYGILVSDKLAPGVMPLHDFWKGGDKPRAGDEKPAPAGGKK